MGHGPVLVVDDDAAIRESLGQVLSGEGYDVLYAENGRQALDLVHAKCPGLILLDLMMPVMSGWEVLEELLSEGMKIPVIIISAMTAPGAKACISKPIDLGALLDVVEKYCVHGGGEKMSGPGNPKNDQIEVTCPTCKAKISISVKDAERTMKARCPKGHEIPLVKAL